MDATMTLTGRAYASLEELLAPETMSVLERRRVDDVRVEELVPAISASGSRFLSVKTVAASSRRSGGRQSRRYVVKRISYDRDHIMRLTEDLHGREAQLWRSGLLDSLPPELMSPIVACARDGTGWVLLMHDVGECLVRQRVDQQAGARHCPQFMDSLAALHAAYWESPQLETEAVGFCAPWSYFRFSSPRAAEEVHARGKCLENRRQAWEHARDVLDGGLCDAVMALIEDPRPLCEALGRCPRTLVHGDFSSRNLGIMGDRTVIMDWQFVMRLAGTVDIGWHLMSFADQRPDNDGIIAVYRDRLALRLGDRFDAAQWDMSLRLGLLGSFVFLGFLFVGDVGSAYCAPLRADLAWWTQRVREGLNLL